MRMRHWLIITVLGPAMGVPGIAQHSGGGHGGGGFSGGGHASGGVSSAPSHAGGGPSLGSASAYHSHAVPPRPVASTGYSGAAPARSGLTYHAPNGRSAYALSPRPGSSSAAASSSHRAASARPLNSHYGASSRASSSSSSVGSSRSGSGNYGRRPSRGVTLYAYSPRISPLGWWLGPWQFYPWLDADLSWDFWHDTGDDNTSIAMASTGANMVEDAPPQGNGADENEAEVQADDDPVHGTAMQIDSGAPALTLVYLSGQTELVSNYVVSRSAVTIIDGGGIRSVPVSALDLPAMAQINGQAGLALPAGLQR